MQQRNHPSFAAGFIKVFLPAFFGAALCFVGGFYFVNQGNSDIGMIFFGLFVAVILLLMVIMLVRMFFVSCPECGGRTRTVNAGDHWRAECAACQISWNLGVGSRSRRY